MAMLKITKYAYLAIINEEKMIEIRADSKERAREIAEKLYDGDIRVCKIPGVISYVGENLIQLQSKT